MVERMRTQAVVASLRSQPETAIAIQRHTFKIELLSWSATTGDFERRSDPCRCLRGINGEDGWLVAIETVIDRIERALAVWIGGKA